MGWPGQEAQLLIATKVTAKAAYENFFTNCDKIRSRQGHRCDFLVDLQGQILILSTDPQIV
jgi:hypothetical protein